MELWIRSQNRENTVKIINQYGLKYNDKTTIIANYQPDFTDKYDGYYEILGKYNSNERALEVLDEIQRKIKFMYIFENAKLEKESCIEQDLAGTDFNVYEMPKN